jgi:hypothetical protein
VIMLLMTTGLDPKWMVASSYENELIFPLGRTSLLS